MFYHAGRKGRGCVCMKKLLKIVFVFLKPNLDFDSYMHRADDDVLMQIFEKLTENQIVIYFMV